MYIQGKVIDKNYNVIKGLTTLYGIGKPTAENICNNCLIHYKLKIGELTYEQQSKLNSILSTMKLDYHIKKKRNADIFNLINNKTYRGYKHLLGLPVKGQRTKTNARTRIKHKNTQVKLLARDYFRGITKNRYINAIQGRISPTSHANRKRQIKNKKKK